MPSRIRPTFISASTMRLPRGLVIVDTTFLKALKDQRAIAKIESACRCAHLEIVPSVPNVLEALKHPNADIRAELLAALRRWTIKRPLNPWPLELLRLSGRALPSTEFTITAGQFDALLDDTVVLDDDHEKAKAFLRDLETHFVEPYAANRPAFQATLKKTGQKYLWSDVGAFLASADWVERGNQEHLLSVMWELAGLSGSPPALEVVLRSELWRLALDAFGAATYSHAISADRWANPPGFIDLMQLLYLSQHSRARIFVTDDESLRAAAKGILDGRYPNTRVMRGPEFLDSGS